MQVGFQYSMTRNYYSDIVVKKRRNGLKRVGIVLLVIVCLISVVALSDLFSTMLTTGRFSFSLFREKEYKFDSRVLYAVTMGESKDKFTAYTIASGASILGAGGYVWYENDNYIVIANIYQSKEDATKVLENISTTEHSTSILEIDLDSFDIGQFDMEKTEKESIYKAVSRIYQLYTELYDMSNNIDTKKITYIQASSIINSYKSECKVIKSSIGEIYSRYNDDELRRIESAYVHIIEILDSLVYKLLEGNQTTSVVKHGEIDVVYRLNELLQSL